MWGEMETMQSLRFKGQLLAQEADHLPWAGRSALTRLHFLTCLFQGQIHPFGRQLHAVSSHIGINWWLQWQHILNWTTNGAHGPAITQIVCMYFAKHLSCAPPKRTQTWVKQALEFLGLGSWLKTPAVRSWCYLPHGTLIKKWANTRKVLQTGPVTWQNVICL